MKKPAIILCMFVIACMHTFAQRTVTDEYPGVGNVVYTEVNGIPNGPFKLYSNSRSYNGGSYSMVLSGNMKMGKRDGIWTGTITYNNYGDCNTFTTGTETMLRTYKNGALYGKYTFTKSMRSRNGYMNRNRVFVYEPYAPSVVASVTAMFKDNLLDGIFTSSRNFPKETAFGKFDLGTMVGEWEIYSQSQRIKLSINQKSQVTHYTDVNVTTFSGTELKYTPTELANLDYLMSKSDCNKEVRINDVLYYFDQSINGFSFAELLRTPSAASNENVKIPTYMLVDSNNHLYELGTDRLTTE